MTKSVKERQQTRMTISLQFPLDVDDEWPPFGSESLPFEEVGDKYRCLSAPLFVKDLSVGDIIKCEIGPNGFLNSWRHCHRSNRSVIWLLRQKENDKVQPILQLLRQLGCNTAGLDELGSYAIDVPETVEITEIDKVLEELDQNTVAIAFPSMRHPETLDDAPSS
ncbi:MAG: hypothetical protein RL145_279 [Pseudomonadota bacterium]|jgi:hypothetical protein